MGNYTTPMHTSWRWCDLTPAGWRPVGVLAEQGLCVCAYTTASSLPCCVDVIVLRTIWSRSQIVEHRPEIDAVEGVGEVVVTSIKSAGEMKIVLQVPLHACPRLFVECALRIIPNLGRPSAHWES